MQERTAEEILERKAKLKEMREYKGTVQRKEMNKAVRQAEENMACATA